MAVMIRSIPVVICVVLLSSNVANAQSRRGGGKPPVQQDNQVPQKIEKSFPQDVSMVAVSLNGKTFEGSDRPTLILDQNYRARGFGGCNTFSATAYPLKEQGFAVGPLALTKKPATKP